MLASSSINYGLINSSMSFLLNVEECTQGIKLSMHEKDAEVLPSNEHAIESCGWHLLVLK